MSWADRAALEALRRADGTTARTLAIFAHILGAEHVWLARLRGRDPEVAVWPQLDLDGCAKLLAANRDAYRRYSEELGPEDLRRSVHYRNSAGREFDSTVEDILAHVAMHGSYHRGQVAVALRDAGDVPEPTDYIGFVRGAPAATREAAH